MLFKVREAEQLMKKALGLLDEAGELRAARKRGLRAALPVWP